MVLHIICFVAGIGALQTQPLLPERASIAWLIPPLLVLLLRSPHAAAQVLRKVAGCLLAGGVGFFWAALVAHDRLADELPSLWEGQDIRVVGVIAKLPQPFHRGIRFQFDVESVLTSEAQVPKRISVAWYGPWRYAADSIATPDLRVAERWQMTVRLRRPHGTANPHGFDYEAWLLERGIRATGYVRLNNPPQRVKAFVPRPGYVVESVREAVRRRILTTLEGEAYAGVIAALVMGDQRAIPASQWTVFTRTGINHLMSISGLHVTMIAALVSALVFVAWRRSARLVLRLPARRAAVAAGMVSALAYALIAGFAVPAQRTVYMLCVAGVSIWSGQASSAVSVLSLALLAVTLIDPWAVLAPGFWLSFGAVAVILYVSLGRLRTPHWLIAWGRAQWAVTLGLIPVLLAVFQQVSIVSPLANAVAMPVVSLLVVPIALVGTLLPFDFVLLASHGVMEYTMVVLEWLAALPDSVWEQHAPPLWTVALALLGIAWLLLPAGFPARWVGQFLMLPLFTQAPAGPAPGSVRLAVLDVGQGLAVVVRTAKHALVYDAGPMFSPEVDSGSRIIVPYLRAVGIRRLDGVIVTHADNDHAGGAASVLDAVPVAWVLSSLPAEHVVHARVQRSERCIVGQRWEWDGVRFEMLHPDSGSYSVGRMKANDRSCVLRISGAGTRILLSGDIEARSEREMLARDADSLRSEILVAPHHGSTTSSTPEFLAAVRPEVSIFTVGYRNRFGHPRPVVLQRYDDIGSRILRTDRHGALRFEIEPDAVRFTLEREVRRRYWQHPPDGAD